MTASSAAVDSSPGRPVTPLSRLNFHRQPQPREDLVGELLNGLRQPPRSIDPKFFYDSRGARLFDHITRLPEYYPTRVERQIYHSHSLEMAEELGSGRVLIEPGSGSSEKVTLLLEALRPDAYVPLEITESHLLEASKRLVNRYPWLTVHAVCGDYSNGIDVPAGVPGGTRLLFFPGSTIGNFEPAGARRFLSRLHRACGEGGSLLIGVDLRKDPAVLNAAYNDAAGVTACFNLNALHHINRLADGDFDAANFRHRAFFNEDENRVEMHLESLRTQTVTLARESLSLARGECIHTENSYKYTVDGFHALAAGSGFEPRRVWQDKAGWFSVLLLDAA